MFFLNINVHAPILWNFIIKQLLFGYRTDIASSLLVKKKLFTETFNILIKK